MSGPMPTWLVGAFICLFGSTLTALGLVVQKHSHNSGVGEAGTKYFLRKWWILGFCIFLLAQIINMVAMAMTPQVVLSCLGSWTLVCNTVFAQVILRETMSRSQAVAVAGLVGATAMVLYTAPQPSAERESHISTANELAARFVSPEFEISTAFLWGVGCLIHALAEGVSVAIPPIGGEPSRSTSFRGKNGTSVALMQRSLLPTSWAVVAAIAAGYTALLFKCVAEIIAGAVARPDMSPPPWSSWKAYAIAGVALTCAPTELHCLNLALKLGEAALVVPTYLALGMLAQLYTGAIFFEELNGFRSAAHALVFGLSVLLTLTFVVLMAETKAIEAGEPQVAVSVPELQVDLVRAATDGPAGLHPPMPMTPNGTHVSVPGFGGAIECLESPSKRGRSKHRASSCPPF